MKRQIHSLFVVLLALLSFRAVSDDTHLSVSETSLCAVPQADPLITHYDAGIGGFSLTGTDVDDMLTNQEFAQQFLAGKRNISFYRNAFPKFENWVGMNYSTTTYSNDRVVAFLQDACQKTGSSFRLVQPGIEIRSRYDLERVIERRQPDGQIVHSLVFRNNLFTVIIPPHWSPEDAKYVALINGFYDINAGLVMDPGPYLLDILGKLYMETGHGGVGILWNGGGAMATYTMNDQAYQDLNDFMKMAIPVLGIDRKRVIAFGGSRGGVTALNIASHSAIDAFRVRYVYSNNPPNDIYRLSRLVGPTFPALILVAGWTTGYVDAAFNYFRYPTGVAGLSGRSGDAALRKVLTGTADHERFHDHFNLDSPEKVGNLVARKTQVHLDFGTNDQIVPDVDKMALLHAYRAAGVKIEARITYLEGHSGHPALRVPLILSAARQLTREILDGAPEVPMVVPGRLETFLATEDESHPMPYTQPDGSLPLAVDIPWVVTPELRSFLAAVGEPHRRYRLAFQGENGQTTFFTFRIKANGTWQKRVRPQDFPMGQNKLVQIEILDQFGQSVAKPRMLPMPNGVTGNVVIRNCLLEEIFSNPSITNPILEGVPQGMAGLLE